jgi:hypothetical protein
MTVFFIFSLPGAGLVSEQRREIHKLETIQEEKIDYSLPLPNIPMFQNKNELY